MKILYPLLTLLVAASSFWLGRHLALPDATLSHEALATSAYKNQTSKPPATTSEKGKLPLPDDTGTTVKSPPASWADAFPDWEHLLLRDAGSIRLLGFSDKLRTCPVTQLPQLAAWLDQMPGLMREEKELLYETWATYDAQAVIAWLQGAVDYQPQYIAAALHAWAAQEPQAAAQHFATLSPPAQSQCFKRWMQGWAKSAPEAADAYVRAIIDEKQRDEGLQTLLTAHLQKNPTQAQAWMQRLSTEEQAKLNHSMATQLAVTDPLSAEAFLATQPNLILGRESIRHLANAQMQRSGKAPLEWALKHPQPQNRADAIGIAIGLWARSDPSAAATWLNQEELGNQRDAVVTAFAEETALHAPASAMEWAQSLSSSEQRQATVEHVLAHWQRTNHQAAKQWAEAHGQMSAYQTLTEP